MKKVYGVNGLMEWHALIPVGAAKIHVHFTDGSLSGYGVIPATYITSDKVMQAIIENSAYFKSGKIYLVRTYGAEVVASAKKTDAVTLVRKEFSTVDDARDFLVTECDVPRIRMRNASAVVEQGKAKGYDIVIASV